VLLNDPPKGIGVSLDEIARKCDIITFHTPLDATTYHLCAVAFLSKCLPHTLIINAARGGVVDETALLQSGHPYILDTWENEPKINRQVLQNAFRASMHIAGYSEEGKRNASQMCLDAISEVYGMPRIVIRKPLADNKQEETQTEWLFAITKALKAQPDAFETLRKAYPLR
jgi:erythronate-4-phosphate dehydrogenase